VKAAASPRTVFPVVLAQKERVKGEGAGAVDGRGGGRKGKREREERSHRREQQPADWPFYRADRSRLYEESHNGNLLSSLALPADPSVGLSPCGFSSLFHVFFSVSLSLSLSRSLFSFSPRFVFSLLVAATSSTRPFDRTAISAALRRGVGRINAD